MRLIPAGLLLALPVGLAACASAAGPQELSLEAACLSHFENDPLGRDRCRMSGATRSDSVPDVRPQDLPIRIDGPGDGP
jgi:hypothetical protein